MSSRVDSRDWERYFGSRARRRGGPLRALANVLLFLVIVAALGFGGTTLFQYGIEQQQADATARAAQISTQNAEVLAAQTASVAEEQTAAAETAVAGTAATTSPAATTVAEIGSGTAIASGNLRSEPLIAPETVIGQLCAGDQIAFLERRQQADITWYRVRVTATGPDCAPQRVTAGSSGWASVVLTGEPLP